MVRLAALPAKESYTFTCELRTRTNDTDNQGLLNHATYFALLEEARTLYMHDSGAVPRKVGPMPFVQHSTNIRFVSPGQGGESVLVDVSTVRIGKTSFIQAYRVRSRDTGDVRVVSWHTLVYWNAKEKCKLDIPPKFRAAIARFERDRGGEKLDELNPMPLSEVQRAVTDVKTAPPPFRFRLRSRTRFVDEDLNGVLSANVYWSLFEEGRLYYFGPSNLDLLPPSLAFPFVLHSSNMRYTRSGHGGRDALIEVKTLDMGRSSFSQHYRVKDAATGELWAEATQVFVCWDVKARKKMAMSELFRSRTTSYDALPSGPPCRVITNPRQGRKQLAVGDWAELTKTFDAASVHGFAALSEDRNPLHLDAKFAATTRFKAPIVHGMLTAALFSGLLGLHLPGKGSVYLQQTVKFRAPLMVGKRVSARVTVVRMRHDKPIVTLDTEATDTATGKVLVKGQAVILAPRRLVPTVAPRAKL